MLLPPPTFTASALFFLICSPAKPRSWASTLWRSSNKPLRNLRQNYERFRHQQTATWKPFVRNVWSVNRRPIIARPVSPPVRIWRWSKRNPKLAGSPTAAVVLGMLLVAVALPMGWSFFSTQPPPAIPEKSIAVLPFENRSEEKANAYFADGIQDEILTRLSKIAALKVISRTSTQHYKSAPENLSDIARQLGVAHILEGSVQKSGDAVRVNVQLINAAT